MQLVTVIKLSVVLHTAGHGGGADEYLAPNLPDIPTEYVLSVELPTDGHVTGAWYTPLENIAAMQAFALIDVYPAGTRAVALRVAAAGGAAARMRIAIHVLFVAQPSLMGLTW